MWIARDSDGELYIFEHKPTKGNDLWVSDTSYENIPDECNLFRSVKWSDDEPTEIKLVKK